MAMLQFLTCRHCSFGNSWRNRTDLFGVCDMYAGNPVVSQQFKAHESLSFPVYVTTTWLSFPLSDALNVVKRCIQSKTVVPGGGAIEMEVSRLLREYAKTIAGKQQLVVQAFAKALEVIPQQLCDNAGFDSTDVLNALRKKHSTDLK